MICLRHPVLTNTQLDLLCNIRYKGFNAVKLPMVFRAADGPDGMKKALDNLCRNAEKAIDEGANYIILSDRTVDAKNAAIPSILAVSAVHHYLVSVQKRVQTALIVETGEMREVMHAALLLGYGASAINPYMAFAVLDDLVTKKELQLDADTAEKNYVKALCKGASEDNKQNGHKYDTQLPRCPPFRSRRPVRRTYEFVLRRNVKRRRRHRPERDSRRCH